MTIFVTIYLLPSDSGKIPPRKDIGSMKDWVFAICILVSLLFLLFAYIQHANHAEVFNLRSARFKRLFVKVIILLGLLVYMFIRS